MKTTFSTEFAKAAKQGPRLFFAPLVGALNALRTEVRRMEVENQAKPDLTEAARGEDRRRVP